MRQHAAYPLAHIHAHICTNGHIAACVRSTVWLTIKITVATGVVKSSTPVAIVIGPAWQRLNIAMDGLTASARCYCDICVKINMVSPFYFPSQKDNINRIFSTGSSFHPQQRASGHAYVHVQTCPHAPCCGCKENGGAGIC
jgi:hypothetical protein